MRILILSTSDNTGGAAIAARRLLHALVAAGHEARMLVRDKTTDDPLVTAVSGGRLSKAIDRARIWAANGFTRDKLWLTDAGFYGCNVASHPLMQWADVIHLHWVNQGFLSLSELGRILRLGKRVVWTMHDLWPLTGICHLPGDCTRYQSGCNGCPQMCRQSAHDLSGAVYERKRQLFAHSHNLTFTAVSRWEAGMARQSGLIGGHDLCVIPNIIDAGTCTTSDKRPVIVYGAAGLDHAIKGFGYLVEALHHIAHDSTSLPEGLRLVTFGSYRNPHLFDSIPIPHTHLGTINSKQRDALYAEASVVVSSSQSETFGLTLAEGAAHGCVPVAFAGSGPDDIIDHCINGYLASQLDAHDLAQGIRTALDHRDEWGAAARQKVLSTYSGEAVTEKYLQVYSE